MFSLLFIIPTQWMLILGFLLFFLVSYRPANTLIRTEEYKPTRYLLFLSNWIFFIWLLWKCLYSLNIWKWKKSYIIALLLLTDDHSRITLESDSQNGLGDYINANLIKIEKADRRYILTQVGKFKYKIFWIEITVSLFLKYFSYAI